MRNLLFFLLGLLALSVGAQDDGLSWSYDIGGGHDDPDPVVTVTPTEIVIDGQGVARKLCSVEAEDAENYELEWIQKINGEEKSMGKGAKLNYPVNSRQDVDGELFCRATKGSITAEVQHYIKYRNDKPEPKIIVTSEQLNSNLTALKCDIQPRPRNFDNYNFKWIGPNGQMINNQSQTVISTANGENFGNYICEIKNLLTKKIQKSGLGVGIAASGAQYGAALEGNSFKLSVITPDELNEGMDLDMQCIVEPMSQVKAIEYLWTKDNQELSRDATYTIPHLSEKNLGLYRCFATITDLMGTTFDLDGSSRIGEDSNSNDGYPAAGTLRPPPGGVIRVKVAKYTELHCDHDLGRRLIGPWRHNGTNILPNSGVNRTGSITREDHLTVSVLSLSSVKFYQAGLYECEFYDNQNRRQIRQVNLVIDADVVLTPNPPDKEVHANSEHEMHCMITGDNSYTNNDIQWFFVPPNAPPSMRRPVDFNSRSGWIRADGASHSKTSFLQKKLVTRYDAGTYICSLPEARKDAFMVLRIHESKFRIVSKGDEIQYNVVITPKTLTVKPNENFQFECYGTKSNRPSDQYPTASSRNPNIYVQTGQMRQGRISISGKTSEQNVNGHVIECRLGDAVDEARLFLSNECSPNQRRCLDGTCLSNGQFCDGRRDCPDGSDESDRFCSACDPVMRRCETYQGRPANKDFYNVNWECDGENDCGNGYDEQNCPVANSGTCGDERFQCNNSQNRIPKAFVCDKESDCNQGDDESGCTMPTIMNRPETRYEVRENGQVEMICEATGKPLPRVIWRFNWGCLPGQSHGDSQIPYAGSRPPPRFTVNNYAERCNDQSPKVVSKLLIDNFRPGDDGIYNCEAISGSQRQMSANYNVVIKRN